MKNSKILRLSFIIPAIFITIGLGAKAAEPLYRDPAQPIDKRVEDLMSRMTLEEKIAQMCQFVGPDHIRETQKRFKGASVAKNDDAYGFYPSISINDLYEMTADGRIGSFLHVVTPQEANQLQALAAKSRLGIPLLIGIDAIHGNALVRGTTVYPTPIGQASTFNPRLVEEMSRQAAKEVRATGCHWTFTPNIEIARDARWGRVGETFGEDPWLVSRMGVATVRGYQGNDAAGTESVLACAKHLIGGGESANGTNAAPMDVSERTLREVFLPPFKAVVQEAGVRTLMASHNELNGVPAHANQWLITDIMRNEYGFDGFGVSDWMDVERIHELHRVAPDMIDAYRQTVEAGIDMHMHGPGFAEGILQLVKDGRLSVEQIDRACRAILDAKFRLGLFENPYVDLDLSQATIFAPEHQDLALDMAHQSIVLLKNESLLPLDFSQYNKIFVTGPNANSHAILGDWTLEQPDENVITILEGITMAAGNDKVVFYDYGDDVRQYSPDKVAQAVAIAKDTDLAIVVVGENPLRYQKGKTCGENVDRSSIDLLGSQEMLIDEINALGIPTIVVLVGGRPLSINHAAETVPAIIQAWEPGSFGGTAVADIITGKFNPCGKLPVTIPRNVGQIQMIYNHKPSQYFHKYKDGESTPLYPFGYGLSYTTFDYSPIELSSDKIGLSDSFTASVILTNTGQREGTEIVQLYIRDDFSSATRPVKELKDFQRVTLQPGECRKISFNVTPDKLAYYDRNMSYGVEPGTFTIMIGGSSDDALLRTAQIQAE